ncbi:hypothetical protein [Streptomyces iconiensis]|uniref:Uncharacterized protein n=1 Tax=Streptomyces iconiensis TaxID=1384038 RepID=A0ABT7A8A5_9ACTN|nr:hypothetical protein [Streptomyces iconiensis]MDJ1136858.1 hypothetical protein [Streptomyces iconiensis]
MAASPWFGSRGPVHADGPSGFVIEGKLTAKVKNIPTFTQYATFGYVTHGKSWAYETVALEGASGTSAREKILIRGERESGSGIKVRRHHQRNLQHLRVQR